MIMMMTYFEIIIRLQSRSLTNFITHGLAPAPADPPAPGRASKEFAERDKTRRREVGKRTTFDVRSFVLSERNARRQKMPPPRRRHAQVEASPKHGRQPRVNAATRLNSREGDPHTDVTFPTPNTHTFGKILKANVTDDATIVLSIGRLDEFPNLPMRRDRRRELEKGRRKGQEEVSGAPGERLHGGRKARLGSGAAAAISRVHSVHHRFWKSGTNPAPAAGEQACCAGIAAPEFAFHCPPGNCCALPTPANQMSRRTPTPREQREESHSSLRDVHREDFQAEPDGAHTRSSSRYPHAAIRMGPHAEAILSLLSRPLLLLHIIFRLTLKLHSLFFLRHSHVASAEA
ncbi:uncharacterized protein LOC109532584 [Hippocampus comes]|uniref:uncharacterized protein LOC109532584 n=1 Tax=Hippocampus comes TaxID=109280 RepID=UPI00094EB205|nr:PREDICTED: uncharacterized protein LOC109532584 [Hippocampus comes]